VYHADTRTWRRRVEQWLPESARYDVLTGSHEKALATLKRIAAENGVPMPLGKLVAARQVGRRTDNPSPALRMADSLPADSLTSRPSFRYSPLTALQESRGRFQDLFSPDFRCTTVLLWFIW